jgi:parallel beta-helix repeat protein
LERSAIVGNEASGNGGGIYLEPSSGGSIRNSVITSNGAGNTSGGVYMQAMDPPPSNVFLANSIIVNNSDNQGTMVDDVFAGAERNFISEGYNRVGNGTNGLAHGVNGDYVKPAEITVDYVVTRLGDSYRQPIDTTALSVREAINEAQVTVGAQEIWLPAWRFLLTVSGTAAVNQGDFDITSQMTIRGVGPGLTILDGSVLSDRHFDIASGGTLDLSYVTLALGDARSGTTERDGGAIRVGDGGHLVLDHSAVVGNVTGLRGEGGGVYFGPTGSGVISNSVITVNESDGPAGGIYLRDATGTGGVVTLTKTIVANNSDSDGMQFPDVYAGTNRQITSTGYNRLTSTGPNYAQHVTDSVGGSVNYVVTGLTDTFDGSGDTIVMSLRDAIHQANTISGTQEIWLPAWDFVLTIGRGSNATDTEVKYGDLDILGSTIIRGIQNETSVAWRSGAAVDKLFELVGDYNSDEVVNNADFIVWQESVPTQDLAADGNDDGQVNAADYDEWFARFNNTLVLEDVLVA